MIPGKTLTVFGSGMVIPGAKLLAVGSGTEILGVKYLHLEHLLQYSDYLDKLILLRQEVLVLLLNFSKGQLQLEHTPTNSNMQ